MTCSFAFLQLHWKFPNLLRALRKIASDVFVCKATFEIGGASKGMTVSLATESSDTGAPSRSSTFVLLKNSTNYRLKKDKVKRINATLTLCEQP